jgi:surfactin synthase thioesterase subunit
MNKSAPLRLFCLPFAGGNSFAYRPFEKSLEGEIEVVALDLPGHGLRFGEPQLESLDEMANYLISEMRPLLDEKPYAIFGHSMGGMLAFLVTRRIHQLTCRQPLRIFISARRPGACLPLFYWTELSREEFLERISRLGGIPDEVMKNKELMALFEPVLYQDVKALETHEHDGVLPVFSPVTVMIGDDDDISPQQAALWSRDTVGAVQIEIFPGGHFFAFRRSDEVCAKIKEQLFKQHSEDESYHKAVKRVLAGH